MTLSPGSLVGYREREWVVMPSEEPEIMLLRPIGGSTREVCGVLKPLADAMLETLPFEEIKSARFPLPDPATSQDHVSVRLTLDAARLLLREGSAPFRSLGHLSFRPRPYQFVPLVMALRLPTVRVLIADDVGVGKTIEAGLIARELLDRGEVRRIAVLCPPYLCDQWHKELAEKFHIDAPVIRSGTVSRLERQTPPDRSIFEHCRHFVASIDMIKGDRYRASFLQHCPRLLIVDEVHGAARPPGGRRGRGQQQRHGLLRDLASDGARHLIMLTATPHSGVEEPFMSLLGLLQEQFESWNLAALTTDQRVELARHFVQRRRADVKRWLGETTPFPERDSIEEHYKFTKEYQRFYRDVYDFARDVVQSAETLTGWKRRMRFWSALALLRCVTSSPAAAETALMKRVKGDDADVLPPEVVESDQTEELDGTFEPMLYDPTEAEAVVDAPPGTVFEAQEQDPDWQDADRKRLREFAKQASKLKGKSDAKLAKLTTLVKELLKEGYQPIVWCRYIATADYVAAQLQRELQGRRSKVQVTAASGALSDDQRRLKVEELSEAPQRVLVATDCLSEGINLQDHFTAVIHYDLPWNPNRLEQREGRVDRFGQTADTIKAVLLYGEDNPVDGAVLDVLLRKARAIHRHLGIHVPIPMNSETVMETVLQSLFAGARYDQAQLTLFDQTQDASALVQDVHERWEEAADRERESRSRFAQRAVKPEEVAEALSETDDILGNPAAVQAFLLEASQRVGFPFRRQSKGVWSLGVGDDLPPPVRLRLGDVPDPWPITFESPTPEDIDYVGRNHPLVEGLAEHVMDMAFHPPDGGSPATRCGVIRSDGVGKRTTLLLLRLRFLIHERAAKSEQGASEDLPSLGEETLVWGFTGSPPQIDALDLDEARQTLDEIKPTANVSPTEKQRVLDETLAGWDELQKPLNALLRDRSRELRDSHRRVRSLLKQSQIRIEPQTPPDLLGIVVVLPVPKGVKK